jgi:hypothetical protein
VAAAIKAASPATAVWMLTGWGQRLAATGDNPPNVDRVLGKPPNMREVSELLALQGEITVASQPQPKKPKPYPAAII